ncbi:poly-gamma-glutamate biosynthesis protein PgsC/CapC [Fretibacterium sp. OH1220_COT-178]|uniref:poly-gamma-glutamate biosynthesis protein PgsC/CapC n=1 Tax=Fretibacterium sp. OH1220_COT-178 TaxID=2491047 RepID=UPI001F16C609|nr:poly-gamma-glutamate biosynthesis protein PgsC/CapC [Fretibacterium sp. OH1220_COT-178]
MNELLFFSSPFAAPALSEGVTVGIGVLFGLIWSRRTGWSCGGLVTPGLLALHAGSPYRIAMALALGGLLAAPLGTLSHALGLYGRERVGAAMLLALAVRLVLTPFVPVPFWIGWVVPGLVAADAQRQGVSMTLCGALSCAVATAFATDLIRGLSG